jgi:protein SCO1/2
MRRVVVAVALTAFLLLPSGCGRTAPQAGVPAAVAPTRTTVEYPLVGVVRQVDPTAGTVTVRHEAIPGFMDAMTMPFTVKDRRELDDLRPGDGIEATLRVLKEGDEVQDYELTGVVVAKPAESPGLTLNLGGGNPTVTPSPKPLAPGDPVPDFTMTTQEGKPLKLSELRGKVVALTFIYTRCPLPDFCPRLDRKFAAVADRVSAVPGRADRVRLLSVSFDPEHDTPEVLARHAASQGAKPPLWTFAAASHDELFKVAQPLGLTYGPFRGEVIHNLIVAVIAPDGTLARVEAGPKARNWQPAEVLKTMYSCLPSAGN